MERLTVLLADAASAAAHGNERMLAYAGFLVLVSIFLALDLGVFHRKSHDVSFKEAATWSAVWVSMALLFAIFVYFAYSNHWLGLGLDTPMHNPDPASSERIIMGTVGGWEAVQQYISGYVIEQSLSMDNVFVIALILKYFAIPNRYQHRVLFWGIIGAVVMRGIMIAIGAQLVHRFEWILIFFGLFLLFTSFKMAFMGDDAEPGNNPVVRFAKKLYPVVDFLDGQRFFTKRTLPPTYSPSPSDPHVLVADPPPAGTLGLRSAMTPLFLCLLLIETTDLIFAVDSIPAIFAMTPDPFIILTSNIFAILGLRSLYFCLAAAIDKFKYLKPALVVILSFVGVKLILMSFPPHVDDLAKLVGVTMEPWHAIKVPTRVSLGVIIAVLATAVIASVIRNRKTAKQGDAVG